MLDWEAYAASLASNLTIEGVKIIYKKYKDIPKVRKPKSFNLSLLLNREVMVTTLIDMLNKAGNEVLVSAVAHLSFVSDPLTIVSNLDSGIKKGLKFRIILTPSESTEIFLERVKFLQNFGIEVRILPPNYQEALSSMQFVCIDRRECILGCSPPQSSSYFGLYITNIEITKSLIESFEDLWMDSSYQRIV